MSVTLTAPAPATIRVLSATMPTDMGTVSYTIDGLGLAADIKAVTVDACIATSLDTDTDGVSWCKGATDGTTETYLAWSCEHVVADSDTYTEAGQDAVITILDPADGTTLATAVFDSWTDGGVVLDWTTAPASAYRMSLTFYAGEDVEADLQVINPNDSASGTVTVTPGYSASTNLVLGWGGLTTTAFNGTTENAASVTYGSCSNDGTTVLQTCGGWYDGDASAVGDPNALIHSGRTLQFVSSGSLGASMGCSGFNAGTGAFTWTTVSVAFPAAGRVALLMLHLPIEAKSYGLALPTATGTTAFTEPGFTPQFMQLATSPLNSVNVIRTNGLAGSFSSGAADVEGRSWAGSWSDEDSAATTNTQCRASESAADCPLDTGGTTGFLAALDSWDATGFTLDFDSVVSASTRYGFGFAIEEDPGDDILIVNDEGAVATDAVVTSLVDPELVVVDEGATATDAAETTLVDPELEVIDEGAVATDAVETTLVDPELVVVDEGAVATDASETTLVDAITQVVDEGVVATDAAETTLITNLLEVVDESSVATDAVVTLLGANSLDASVLADTAYVGDEVRIRLRTPVVRSLMRPGGAVGAGAAGATVGGSRNPQASINPPGLDVETQLLVVADGASVADSTATATYETLVTVVSDVAIASEDVVEFRYTFLSAVVVDEGVDVADGTDTTLTEIIVEVVDEGVDVSDGVVTELDTYTPPGDFDPPDLGFPDEYYIEPPLGRLSIPVGQFNLTDARDDVVDVYNPDIPYETQSPKSNYYWRLQPSKVARAHYKGRTYVPQGVDPPPPGGIDLPSGSANQGMRSSLTIRDITWTFDTSYLTGQYVTGDWWVRPNTDGGNVTVTSVSPPPVLNAGDAGLRHGSMKNPIVRQWAGLDGRAYGFLDTTETYPVTLNKYDTLLSSESVGDVSSYTDLLGKTISITHGATKSAEVLTCIDYDRIPNADELRPPMVIREWAAVADNLRPYYSVDRIIQDRIPNITAESGSLGFTAGESSRVDSIKRIFERPWLFIMSDSKDRNGHPGDNMPNYHREIFTVIGDALALLISDEPDKGEALVAVLQAGIDCFYAVDNAYAEGLAKPPSSAHRGLCIFTGRIINSDQLSAPKQFAPGSSSDFYFREQWMTYHIDDRESTLDSTIVTAGESWHGGEWCWRQDPDTTHEHEHLYPDPEWDIVSDGSLFYGDRENYRGINSQSYAGEALAMLYLDQGYSRFSHEAFFRYTDRWMDDDWTSYKAIIDAAGWTPPIEQGDTGSVFQRAMWDEHRSKISYTGIPWQMSHCGIKMYMAPDNVTGNQGNQIGGQDWVYGNYDHVHFWDFGIYNEGNQSNSASQFHVGNSENAPGDLMPGEDWSNSPRAAGDAGVACFHRCHARRAEGNTADSYGGWGGKFWLHPQGNGHYLVDRCRFEKVQEHCIYMEWVQRFHIKDSVFLPTGGNAVQVPSRGGHVVEPNYQHGNRLNRPSGLNGWALIEGCDITSSITVWVRNSSEISFSGFLGDIVIKDTVIRDCLSGILLGSDAFKGAWLANGSSVPWDQPILWRSDVEGGDGSSPPADHYTIKECWIDNVTIIRDPNPDATSQRGGMQLTSAYAIHINRFSCLGFSGGGNWAIRVNNDMQGFGASNVNRIGVPMRNDPLTGLPAVYFYDQASVLAHVGSIAYWDKDFPPNGKFVAFTYAELDQMTIGGLP